MVKRTKQNAGLVWKFKRLLSGSLFLVWVALMTASCGDQSSQESGQSKESDGNLIFDGSSESDGNISVETDKENNRENETDSNNREEAVDGPIAVADFYYMPLNTLDLKDSTNTGYYTIDGEWLYYATEVNTAGEGGFPPEYHIYISRGRIADGYQEEDYIVQSKERTLITLHALLADGQGNCYIFWGPGPLAEEEDRFYSLEKYGSSGELLWRADYSSGELQDMGDALNQGTVTADGRVFLYNIGKSGQVFSFDPDGSLAEVYAPELEALEGVATGKDGKTYGYCITKENPVFTELGGSGEKYSCPEGILEVYDGRGSNLCVRKDKGVWSYIPETGELERLWGWEDEYIQISENDIDAVFRDGEGFMVLCSEYRSKYSISTMDRRPVQTFASVTLEDRGKYPPRQRITLGTVEDEAAREFLSKLDLMVRMYNRQSREYIVEFVKEDSEDSMLMKFMQRKCADIIDLTDVYAGNLAGIGAFEDLTAYYEASDTVKQEDILDPVREACIQAGKNVLVMPSFKINTLLSLEEEVTADDWNVWDFLEMAESEWVILGQNPVEVLMYCMGVKCGEDYVDYKNKQCNFDSPEFRRILEACSRAGTYQRDVIDRSNHSEFTSTSIENPWDVAQQSIFDLPGLYSDRIVGYPGMEGAEHRLYPESVFAMNSTSANKEGAWDFLEFLMSEEMQSLTSWGFPSRKDVFERSLSDIYVSPTRTKVLPYIDTSTGKPLDNGFTKEVTAHDIAVLREAVENAKYDSWGGRLSPLWDIVADEAGMYFNGDATLDATISKIQNRVQLYLDEQ